MKILKNNMEIKLKIGDYVETCHLMPAILQKIIVTDCDIFNDGSYEHGEPVEVEELNITEENRHDKFKYDVKVFYPHYKEQYPEYTGGSCCSIFHCGVRRISKEKFDLLLGIGEEKLKILWGIIGKKNYLELREKEGTLAKYEEYIDYGVEFDNIINRYVNNDSTIMRFMQITKNFGKGKVEFKDKSVWLCKKVKNSNVHYKTNLKRYRYIPIVKI